MNGWACLGLLAVGVVVTIWLIHRSPTLPVDMPKVDG